MTDTRDPSPIPHHPERYMVWTDAEQEAIAAHTRAAVEAAVRECARIAAETVCDTHLPTGVRIYGTRAAAAILQRMGVEPTPTDPPSR